MLPSNLNLNIGRTKGYNKKILVRNTDMKIGSNREINRDYKKLSPPDLPNTVVPAARDDPLGPTIPHNLKCLLKSSMMKN